MKKRTILLSSVKMFFIKKVIELYKKPTFDQGTHLTIQNLWYFFKNI
jgi:hypothetical protein